MAGGHTHSQCTQGTAPARNLANAAWLQPAWSLATKLLTCCTFSNYIVNTATFSPAARGWEVDEEGCGSGFGEETARTKAGGGPLPEFKRKALIVTGQFEIFRDGTRFWFRLVGEEREVLAVSGAFAKKAQAAKAIMAVRENAAAGHIVDKSSTPAFAEPARKTYPPLVRRATRQRTRPRGIPDLHSNGTGPAMRSKLKFLIRLDVDMSGARIQVRGRVTERNLGAVYAVARRTSTIISGLAVVLDLRQAAVGMIPLGELRSVCQSGELPSATGSAPTPCRLEILEPAAG